VLERVEARWNTLEHATRRTNETSCVELHMFFPCETRTRMYFFYYTCIFNK